mmetsp:Transcript_51996/g.137348  ORF Transcript_51996/g.137348 Transcript_51996/m.137348 type:complete len:222 (+) Transcript_51996:690-1355(+)
MRCLSLSMSPRWSNNAIFVVLLDSMNILISCSRSSSFFFSGLLFGQFRICTLMRSTSSLSLAACRSSVWSCFCVCSCCRSQLLSLFSCVLISCRRLTRSRSILLMVSVSSVSRLRGDSSFSASLLVLTVLLVSCMSSLARSFWMVSCSVWAARVSSLMRTILSAASFLLFPGPPDPSTRHPVSEIGAGTVLLNDFLNDVLSKILDGVLTTTALSVWTYVTG